MNLMEYQFLARRTVRMMDGKDMKLNTCMGLVGESGELVDLLKKWRYQSSEGTPMPKEQIVKECGDICWYCSAFADLFGINMSNEIAGNLAMATHDNLKNQFCDKSLGEIALFCANVAARAYHDTTYKEAQLTVLFILETVSVILEAVESDLSEALSMNIEKLRKRYPDGFDPERSMHRAADDK